MAKTYDLAIINSGTAAQVASARLRAAGWEIAVVDHRPFGGTCRALRGCDPKKMLISGAEAIDGARRMRGHGVSGGLQGGLARADGLQAQLHRTPVPQKQEQRYAARGIDAFHDSPGSPGPTWSPSKAKSSSPSYSDCGRRASSAPRDPRRGARRDQRPLSRTRHAARPHRSCRRRIHCRRILTARGASRRPRDRVPARRADAPSFRPGSRRLAHGEVPRTRDRRAHALDSGADRQDGRRLSRACVVGRSGENGGGRPGRPCRWPRRRSRRARSRRRRRRGGKGPAEAQ